MPRSLTRPQTGQVVWYYAAAPPVGQPNAALVVNTVDKSTFGLAVFDRATGVASYVPSVPFHYGTRPASGAWCTMMRVNEPAAGMWPSSNMEAHDYEENALDHEQRQLRRERIAAEEQIRAATALTGSAAAIARQQEEYARAAG